MGEKKGEIWRERKKDEKGSEGRNAWHGWKGKEERARRDRDEEIGEERNLRFLPGQVHASISASSLGNVLSKPV